MKKNGENKIFYGFAIANVIVSYLVTFGFIGFLESSRLALVCFAPAVMGIANLILIFIRRKHLDRTLLLNCTVLIKYCLIPFYVFGGGAIVVMFVITIMFGGFPALLAAFLGYTILLGVAPFSVTYIIKSYKDKIHGVGWVILGIAAQFFFTADVIAIMILGLKERRFVRLNIFLLAPIFLGIEVIALIPPLIFLAAEM